MMRKYYVLIFSPKPAHSFIDFFHNLFSSQYKIALNCSYFSLHLQLQTHPVAQSFFWGWEDQELEVSGERGQDLTRIRGQLPPTPPPPSTEGGGYME